MQTIAVINQKGGCGKTSTCAAVGAGLFRAGYKVLHVDFDGQCNLSAMLGADMDAVTVADLLNDKRKQTAYAIQDTPQGGIIPASGALSAADFLSGKGALTRLRDVLEPIQGNFHVALIDCGPTLGRLSIAALTAADWVLIPVKPDRFSLDALTEINNTIEAVREHTNSGLKVLGVVVCMYNPRATIARLSYENIQKQADALDMAVLQPPIRRSVSVEEAEYGGGSIFDNKGNAAHDYGGIVDEIISRLNLRKGV